MGLSLLVSLGQIILRVSKRDPVNYKIALEFGRNSPGMKKKHIQGDESINALLLTNGYDSN